MEKQYKLTDRVSKDSLKSPTFKKWLKRVLCFVFILSLALQLTLCCIPMHASAQENDSIVGTWVFNDNVTKGNVPLDKEYNINVEWKMENGQLLTRTTISPYKVVSGNSGRYYYVFFGNVSVYGYNSDGIRNMFDKTFTITGGADIENETFITWLKLNATKVVEEVHDFTGEYRLFNEQLTNLSFAQSGTVSQTYQFDYQIWNGYSADYFTVQASGSQVDICYAFIDEGSGGVTTVYRQLLRNGQKVGTWLVPRARLIYFESNPDDPTFQQWLLDNTVLIDESMLQTVYDFGYNNGFNDGWTDNLIGDTLNAPIQALNNITLLQVGNTVITLGGVIFTMIVLCILIVFLKKFAGG